MERIIRSRQHVFSYLNLKRLWEVRTAILFLLRRDILVTYKQTVLGVAWNIIRPLITALIIVFVFDQIGNFPDFGIPYFLLAMSALIIWEFFSNAVNWGSVCLLDDREIITKMNFPRVILPFNASIRNLLGFGINLVLTLMGLIYYGLPLHFNLVYVFLSLPVLVLFIFGVNLWLCTINVFYRDIQAIVPFLLRIGLFVSPVGFTLHSIPEEWKMIYAINPLVGIIEVMRFAFFGEVFLPDFKVLGLGLITTIVLLVSGLWLFGKFERRFADVI